MSYPAFIEASLVEIDGTSCGTLTQRMELDSNASPPEYNAMSGQGDFDYAKAWRTDLGGGNYTWELRIRYSGGGACDGFHDFLRSTAADDPTGDYCLKSGGGSDCDAGKALVVESP